MADLSVSTTVTSITVQWNEPQYPSGTITGYRVTIARTDDITLSPEVFSVDETAGNFFIDQLTPATEYNITISAINQNGVGPLLIEITSTNGTGKPYSHTMYVTIQY